MLPAAAIVAATLIAYMPALRAGYIWDDDKYLTTNPRLTTVAGLEQIWFKPGATPQYYPLVFTTFWLEYRLWGLTPFGYHLVNVLLHAGNALLLWHILLRLSIPGAALAAALFALHPVEVESVAWITERKNVLSGFFFLCSLSVYMSFARMGKPASPSNGLEKANRETTPLQSRGCPDSTSQFPVFWRWPHFAAALILFTLALLSKTTACSLPAVILLLLWWKRDRLQGRDIVPLLPMFAIGLALAWLTIHVEHEMVGAEGREFALTPLERCLVAGRALWFYAGKILWPHPLIFIYPRWQIDAADWRQHLFPTVALGVMIALFLLRRRFGKGPLVAVLYFSGNLVPALGFFNVYQMRYSFVADHFQYLASIGMITLIAALLTIVAHRFALRPKSMRSVAAVSILLILAVLTWRQARAYEDLPTLYRDILAKNPSAWMAHNNLALILARENRHDVAVDHLRQAVQLNPAYAEARNNLGMMLLKAGHADEAAEHLREAICLEPDFSDAHTNLAALLVSKGRMDEAVAHFRNAIRLNPLDINARFNLGCTLSNMGRFSEAAGELREVLRLNPNDAQAREAYQVALNAKSPTSQPK